MEKKLCFLFSFFAKIRIILFVLLFHFRVYIFDNFFDLPEYFVCFVLSNFLNTFSV